MQIDVRQPVVVGVPLDETTNDVLQAAVTMARVHATALVPVHALPPFPFPNVRRTREEGEAARARVVDALSSVDTSGVSIAVPIVEECSPAALLLDVADRVHAQLVVVGALGGPTVVAWALGTVADRVVHAARCPVLVSRGTMPGPDRPIVCAVDLSPHSRLGFEAALREARATGAPLRVVTVVAPTSRRSIAGLDEEASELERTTRAEVHALLREHDVRGVAVDVRVEAGDPASVLLDESSRAFLVVLASRAFDAVVPASFGDVTSRVVREARCSVLAIRDLDPQPEQRARLVQRVGQLRDDARAAMEAGDLQRASSTLRVAAALLPGHAPIDDDLATVLDRAGRPTEAERYRALARVLRAART